MLVIFDDARAWQIGQGADRAMPLEPRRELPRSHAADHDDSDDEQREILPDDGDTEARS